MLDSIARAVAAAPALAALLALGPDVRALATSRVPLRVRGEPRFAVPETTREYGGDRLAAIGEVNSGDG